MELAIRWMRFRPARAFASARIGDLAQDRDQSQLLHQRRIERDLVQAVEDLACRARNAGTLDRIDLNEHRIARCALTHEWRDGRITHITAVPIRLAVNLDRLEQRRQAGGGEQHVGSELGIAKYVTAPGADIGGGDEQPDRRLRKPRKVDALGQDIAHGVGAARIEVIGREHARGEVEGKKDG